MTDDKLVHDIPGLCPNPAELGNSGWNILHTAAAVYPYRPSASQKEAMSNFIYAWSHVYACNWCAYNMRNYLEKNPPIVTEKLALNRYMCEFHNSVNAHTGHPIYDCDPMNVLKRWHPKFPDGMEDRPTIEEQLAQRKHLEEKAKAVQVPEASEKTFDKSIGMVWRQKGNSTDDIKQNPSGFSQKGSSPSTLTQQVEDKDKSGGSFWSFFWRDGKPKNLNSEKLERVPHKKVADNETDVDAVLARLKECQVYCPEDEKKNGTAM